VLFFLHLCALAEAAVITVGSSGADFPAIQDAIDASSPGDRIEVASGLYNEKLDFEGKDVEVVGLGGSEGTMINAGASGRAVTFDEGESSAALLEGFTIRAVSASGIEVIGSSPTLRDLVLNANEGDEGAVLRIEGGSPVVEDCVFTDGTASLGGLVYVEGSWSAPSFSRTTFSGGSASRGGALYLDDNASASVYGCTFSNNRAEKEAGTVWLGYRASFSATDTAFSGGVSGYGGNEIWTGAGVEVDLANVSVDATDDVVVFHLDEDATFSASGLAIALPERRLASQNAISLASGSTTDLSDSTISGPFDYCILQSSEGRLSLSNVTLSGCRSALSSESDTTIRRSHVDENTSVFGAVRFTGSTRVISAVVSESSFAGNLTSGLLVENATVTVDSCTFSDNAFDAGAGIRGADAAQLTVLHTVFAENRAYGGGGGGAILLSETATSASFRDCTFTGNIAEDGNGGAIASASPELDVWGCTFSGNQAISGGGIWSSGSLTVTSSAFTENTAEGGGAVGSSAGPLDVTRSVFAGNSAVDGGAVHCQGSPLRIDHSEFWGNTAQTGGGVCLEADDDWSVLRSRFCANASTASGGALESSGTSSGQIVGNIFNANSARTDGQAGGALWLHTSDISTTIVDHNTFVNNEAPPASGGAVLAGQGMDFTNNILAYTTDGDGLVVTEAEAATTSLLAYSDWWSNTETDVSGLLGPGDISGFGNMSVEPAFVGWTGACGDDLRLDPSSALVDAGSGSDADGSRADIGAYGGEAPFAQDADGDGVDDRTDCDDDDASTYPGAVEIPYDGADNDCEGDGDLHDVDGDGYDGGSHGDDCDDANEAVHPGADDPEGDAVDSNCDGEDGIAGPDDSGHTGDTSAPGDTDSGTETGSGSDTETDSSPDAHEADSNGGGEISGRCACNGNGGAGAGSLLFPLLLAAARRKRRSSFL
jgi:predicted outer membrane repeat protein